MLFDQKKRKGQKVERLDKKRNKEERTLRFWQETRRVLEEKIVDANTEEKSLIDAQLRLIEWLMHLKKHVSICTTFPVLHRCHIESFQHDNVVTMD